MNETRLCGQQKHLYFIQESTYCEQISVTRTGHSEPFKAYWLREAPADLTFQQLYVLPTLYLCVLYLSENKQRLVPLTA